MHRRKELSFLFFSFSPITSVSCRFLSPRCCTAVERIVRLFSQRKEFSLGKRRKKRKTKERRRKRSMNRSARPRHDLSYRRSFVFAYPAFEYSFVRPRIYLRFHRLRFAACERVFLQKLTNQSLLLHLL